MDHETKEVCFPLPNQSEVERGILWMSCMEREAGKRPRWQTWFQEGSTGRYEEGHAGDCCKNGRTEWAPAPRLPGGKPSASMLDFGSASPHPPLSSSHSCILLAWDFPGSSLWSKSCVMLTCSSLFPCFSDRNSIPIRINVPALVCTRASGHASEESPALPGCPMPSFGQGTLFFYSNCFIPSPFVARFQYPSLLSDSAIGWLIFSNEWISISKECPESSDKPASALPMHCRFLDRKRFCILIKLFVDNVIHVCNASWLLSQPRPLSSLPVLSAPLPCLSLVHSCRCFVWDPLSFTRPIWMSTNLELSTGVWWGHFASYTQRQWVLLPSNSPVVSSSADSPSLICD